MAPQWPDPFSSLDDKSKSTFEAELLRELSPGHVLFGIPVKAIGRRFDRDDVLFELLDGTGRVAAVHLTWAGEGKTPPWPWCTLFDGFDVWAKRIREEYGEPAD